jgi:MFS superfamily sulfate permease-like transporter
MTQIVGLDAGTVLVFAGLANVVAGVVFRVPMAVQPMKAIAALAIAGAMSAGQVGVAGLTVGVAMLLIGGLGLAGTLHRAVPRPVLSGLQLVLALQLVLSGLQLALSVSGTGPLRPLGGPDGLLVTLGAFALVLLLHRRAQWTALALTAVGLVGAYVNNPSLLQTLRVSAWQPRWMSLDSSALAGVWLGGLPQMPLTVLNSVLAVSALGATLFPGTGFRGTPRSLAVSVGLMNVVACPLGGMPMCHGSGGLAGQYRLGARSGLSMVILGTAKLTLGLLFGGVALAWMRAFPPTVLGVFLVVAGAALAAASRPWEARQDLLALAAMVLLHRATGSLVASFVIGWTVCVLSRRRQMRPQPAGVLPARVAGRAGSSPGADSGQDPRVEVGAGA